MNDPKTCPACAEQMERLATTCPACGRNLHARLYLKALMVPVVLGVVWFLVRPSADESALTRINDIEAIVRSPADDSVSQKALHLVFATSSNYTVVQRMYKERTVTGKIVEWRHEVHEVVEQGPNRYRVQTAATAESLGAFVTINTRTPIEATRVQSLVPGESIAFKGRIGGITRRHVDIESAVLVAGSTR